MTLYFEIDRHSNKNVICIVDDKHKRLLQDKLDNDPEPSFRILSRYEKRLKAIAVGSTLNRYWLVDALMEAGFQVDSVACFNWPKTAPGIGDTLAEVILLETIVPRCRIGPIRNRHKEVSTLYYHYSCKLKKEIKDVVQTRSLTDLRRHA